MGLQRLSGHTRGSYAHLKRMFKKSASRNSLTKEKITSFFFVPPTYSELPGMFLGAHRKKFSDRGLHPTPQPETTHSLLLTQVLHKAPSYSYLRNLGVIFVLRVLRRKFWVVLTGVLGILVARTGHLLLHVPARRTNRRNTTKFYCFIVLLPPKHPRRRAANEISRGLADGTPQPPHPPPPFPPPEPFLRGPHSRFFNVYKYPYIFITWGFLVSADMTHRGWPSIIPVLVCLDYKSITPRSSQLWLTPVSMACFPPMIADRGAPRKK